jgi:hypothetical protein
MELTHASLNHPVTGEDQLPGTVNYFIGSDSSRWHSNIPTYSKVRYTDAYPGVDLVYYGNQQKLEYDFVVAPGADPRPVKLHFEGATRLTLDNDGDLNVAAKHGNLVFHKPLVYQIKDGKRTPVKGKFQLLANNDLGFTLGSYDHSKELVIDPDLAYSTYLGGSASETLSGVAVDTGGHAYVTGTTYSSDFPVTSGAFEGVIPPYSSTNPPSMAFVTKFHANGAGVIYSTYLGGSGGTEGNAIAVDSTGHAFVTGLTFSDFPVTGGAYQTSAKGNAGFVAMLNSSGTQLDYSTYVNGVTQVAGIAVDSTDHAYVTGWTRSTTMAVTANAFQKTNHGAAKSLPASFVLKLDKAGNAAIYSTYLGGSGGDFASAIAIDGSGHAYVTGLTYSTDYPHTSGAFQTTNHAAGEKTFTAFVTKLNSTGTGLDYSTYLGGSGRVGAGYDDANLGDFASGIAVDHADHAYVTGTAFSTDFPHTSGAYQTSINSVSSSAFVTKLNSAGTGLVYSTFLGGSGVINVAPLDDYQPTAFGDGANAIAVDGLGDAYVVGAAVSNDFPVTWDAYQPQDPSGDTNADGNNPVGFFAQINPQGTQLLYSTFLGGFGCGQGVGANSDGLGDTVSSVAVGPYGDAFMGGSTCSGNFPVSNNGFQQQNNSTEGSTGFVTMFSVRGPSIATITSNANPQKEGSSVTFTAHVQPALGSGLCTGDVWFKVNGVDSGVIALDNTAHANYTVNNLPVGQLPIAVEYLGDMNCLASSGNYTETIIK